MFCGVRRTKSRADIVMDPRILFLLGVWVADDSEVLSSVQSRGNEDLSFVEAFLTDVVYPTRDAHDENTLSKTYTYHVAQKNVLIHVFTTKSLIFLGAIRGDEPQDIVFRFLQDVLTSYSDSQNAPNFRPILVALLEQFNNPLDYPDDAGVFNYKINAEIQTLRSGYMTKQGGRVRTWKRRYFELLGNGNLYYWTDSTRASLKGFVNVRQDGERVNVYDQQTLEGNGWELQTATRDWHFVCPTAEERTAWMNLTTSVINGTDLNTILVETTNRIEFLEEKWDTTYSKISLSFDNSALCPDEEELEHMIADLEESLNVLINAEGDIDDLQGADAFESLDTRAQTLRTQMTAALRAEQALYESCQQKKKFQRRVQQRTSSSSIVPTGALIVSGTVPVKFPRSTSFHVFKRNYCEYEAQVHEHSLTILCAEEPFVWAMSTINNVEVVEKGMGCNLKITNRAGELLKFHFEARKDADVWRAALNRN